MDFSQEHFEELECPVCFEYFKAPIAICSNGHSICGKCKTKITKCPLCRAGILNTTNKTLENLMHKLIVRCEFSTFGCKWTSSIGAIRLHETFCERRPYKCPFPDCTWNHPLSAVLFHLKSKHQIQVQTQRGEIITMLSDFGNRSVWHKARSFAGEIFLQVTKLKEDELYISVSHIGREEITSQFKYTVEISCVNGKESFSKHHVVQNYVGGLDRIMRLRKCVIFPRSTFQKCLTKRSVLKIKVGM